MAKCIPNVYGNADRKLLDQIEAEREKLVVNGVLPEFWQVGSTICTRLDNGYYHLYLFEKDIFEGNILRDYRISRDGKMTETNKFYRVPTREDFYKWCTDRKVNFDLEKCNK